MAGCSTDRTCCRPAASSIDDLTLLLGRRPRSLHRPLGAVTLPGGLLCGLVAGFVFRALDAQMAVRHGRAREMTIVRMRSVRVGAERLEMLTPNAHSRYRQGARRLQPVDHLDGRTVENLLLVGC